jgi:hypothetical protein
MQPSDQFKFPIDSSDLERGSADVVESIDRANLSQEFSPVAPFISDSREERVARATFDALKVLQQTEAPVVTPEKPSIEKFMKHLGDMADVLDNFRSQEISK